MAGDPDRPVFASVIIPTRHRPEMLAQCLDQLRPQTQGISSDLYEVIVTDDGDSPSAQAVAALYPFVRWTKGPGRGPAANRNHGAASSSPQYPWLLFLDDDCIPDAGWLKGYIGAAAISLDTPVLEGRTYADRPQRTLSETSPINETGGVLWSCNLAIRREVFQALGKFNERFPHAVLEDAELHLRIRKHGIQTRFVPSASVCHPWRSVPANWTACRRYCQSFETLLDIHPDQLSKYPPGTFLRGTAAAFLRDTGPKLVKYRSGLGALVRRHVGELRLESIILRRHLLRAWTTKAKVASKSPRGGP